MSDLQASIKARVATAVAAGGESRGRVYRNTDEKAREVAYELAQGTGDVTTDQLLERMALAKTDRPKLLRWLEHASVTGQVIGIREGRGFVWRASEGVQREVSRQRLALPLEQRPQVGYNEDFLNSYEPGRTFYLSDDARKRLHARSKPGTAAFEDLSSHDKSVFLCGLSHGSSAMEGNSYSRLETIKLIQEGLQKKGATEKETFMVLNHHDAVRHLVNNMHYPPRNLDITVRESDVRALHALLSFHLLEDPDMCGAIRVKAVKVHQSAFTPLGFHEDLVHNFKTICEKARAIDDPFEAAFFLLVHLPYLQPFEDCNKRTSRVACNIPLLRRGVLPMSWVGIDVTAYQDGLVAVYEQNSPALLAEVFYEGYMKSSEEFDAVCVRPLDGPNDIALRYRNEIRRVVASVVHEGVGALPDTVDAVDQERFGVLVRGELERLSRMHAGTMVQYGMTEANVLAWREREAGDEGADALLAFSEGDGDAEPERDREFESLPVVRG